MRTSFLEARPMPEPRTPDPAMSFTACLGTLLRRLRTLHGLTQAGLGRRTGYDGSDVGAVVAGAAAEAGLGEAVEGPEPPEQGAEAGREGHGGVGRPRLGHGAGLQ